MAYLAMVLFVIVILFITVARSPLKTRRPIPTISNPVLGVLNLIGSSAETDVKAALEDLNKSLTISSSDDQSKGLIYATRGMVKFLQGRKMDAEKDFEEAIRLSEGKDFIVEDYLQSLEVKIMQMRQHRAKQQKSIV